MDGVDVARVSLDGVVIRRNFSHGAHQTAAHHSCAAAHSAAESASAVTLPAPLPAAPTGSRVPVLARTRARALCRCRRSARNPVPQEPEF